jgi:FAD/FMN-containing dehydrogenase
MPGNASAKQQQTISVGVLQDKMNKTVAHDPAKHTMTIQAGMKLREFAAEATRLGMSVQVGSLPAYAGLTVGGVLSTSGHGSGDQATSNLCDTVISLTWVDHNGDIQKVSTHLWQASCQVRIATVNFQLTGKVFRVDLKNVCI